MRNISMDALRTFLAVYDVGSVTLAADQIGRSQPATSLQIKRLEEILGCALFHRIKKRLTPSDDGIKLYAKARQIIKINDQILSDFQKPALHGSVCLGIPSEFAITLLPEILGRFSAAYPYVALDIVSDLSRNLLSAEQQRRYDLILSLHGRPSKKRKGVIKSDQLVWVGGSQHVTEQQATLPLVLAQEGCIYRQRAIQRLSKVKRPWRLVHTNPDLSGIQSAIDAGLGITVLARSTVPKSLKILDGNHGLPALGSIDICLVTRAGKPTEAANRLGDYIASSLT
ncbi:MAG TPA: LysR family transcriptional regulator [Porticoccaceae bacterium]|nr:LysR family transcriptional regulator [Porticoccaceae bacterium]